MRMDLNVLQSFALGKVFKVSSAPSACGAHRRTDRMDGLASSLIARSTAADTQHRRPRLLGIALLPAKRQQRCRAWPQSTVVAVSRQTGSRLPTSRTCCRGRRCRRRRCRLTAAAISPHPACSMRTPPPASTACPSTAQQTCWSLPQTTTPSACTTPRPAWKTGVGVCACVSFLCVRRGRCLFAAVQALLLCCHSGGSSATHHQRQQ